MLFERQLGLSGFGADFSPFFLSQPRMNANAREVARLKQLVELDRTGDGFDENDNLVVTFTNSSITPTPGNLPG